MYMSTMPTWEASALVARAGAVMKPTMLLIYQGTLTVPLSARVLYNSYVPWEPVVHKFFCLLLILLLPLQSLAMQVTSVRLFDLGRVAHEVEHSVGIEHHHHDAGTIHYDDSEESVQHGLEHSPVSQVVFLSSLPVMLIPGDQVREHALESTTFIPDPVPDNPTRPPVFSPARQPGAQRLSS